MKISIVGANGSVGHEIARHFLCRENIGDKIALVTKSRQSHKQLVSLVHDSPYGFMGKNVEVSTEARTLKASDVIFFSAGQAFVSRNMTQEQMFNYNNELFNHYCEKMEKLCPGALVILITNPVSKLMQAGSGFKKLNFAGVGLANDTLRLRKNFLEDFGYAEENLFMIGDHLANQVPTLSQIDTKISQRIQKYERKYTEVKKTNKLREYVRKRSFELLDKGNVKNMFDFVETVPLAHRGDSRQRFINYITKTACSSSHAAITLFNSVFNRKIKISSEVVCEEYLGLPKSVLGVPIRFDGNEPQPIELDYWESELNVLERCSNLYRI